MPRTTFGDQLEKLMKDRDWSAAELSDRIYNDNGHNRTNVKRWLRIGREEANEKKRQISDDRIQALVEAFELSYQETIYLYGLAGKIPPMRMPSKEQIIRSFEGLVPFIGNFPYPAYILDSRYFRFWLVNHPTVQLIGGRERVNELANCSVFQILFSRRYGIADLFGENLERTQKDQIRRFKALNILRRHEAFYMEYPERLRDKDALTDDEYAVFEDMWNAVNPDEEPAANYFAAADLAFDLGAYQIVFNLTVETVLNLGNLFSISWFHLRNREYEETAKAIFSSNGSRDCVKVWELPGVDMMELLR